MRMENHHILPLWLDISDSNIETIKVSRSTHRKMDLFFQRICADMTGELKNWLRETSDIENGRYSGFQIYSLYNLICDPFGEGIKASHKQIKRKYNKSPEGIAAGRRNKSGHKYKTLFSMVVDGVRYNDLMSCNPRTKCITITHSWQKERIGERKNDQ